MQVVRDLLQEPLERAIKEERHDIAADLMSRLAQTGMFSGMPPKQVQDYVQQFLSIYLRTGNFEGQADGYNKLGYLYIHAIEGDRSQALQYYNQARQLAEKTGNPSSLSTADSNIGYLHVLLGDYATAHTYLERALVISESTDYVARKGSTLVYIGYAERNRGDYQAALSSQNRALEVMSQGRLPLWGTWACRELALILRVLGKYERAEQHAREAIEIARKLGDTRQEGYAHTALGLVLEAQGCPEAADCFRQARTCYREMELYNRSMAPLAGLARLALRDGDTDRASAYIEQILEHVADHELDKTEEGFHIYETCYSFLQANGDPRAAGILSIVQDHLRIRSASIHDLDQQRMFLDMVNHRRIRDATT